jgi:hypothetical protein
MHGATPLTFRNGAETMKTTTTKRTRIQEIYVRHLDSFEPLNNLGTKTSHLKNGVSIVTTKLSPNGASDRAKKAIREALYVTLLAEKNALPGIVAEIVGTTSATRHINVYKVETVDAREQERGVCQVCGGSYAIEGETVALHGYKRPRWGFVVGRCRGSHERAANVDVTLTNAVIAAETKNANETEARLAALPMLTSERYSVTRRLAKDSKDRSYWTSDFDEERSRRYGMESAIRNSRSYVEFAKANILPALGTKYAVVLK